MNRTAEQHVFLNNISQIISVIDHLVKIPLSVFPFRKNPGGHVPQYFLSSPIWMKFFLFSFDFSGVCSPPAQSERRVGSFWPVPLDKVALRGEERSGDSPPKVFFCRHFFSHWGKNYLRDHKWHENVFFCAHELTQSFSNVDAASRVHTKKNPVRPPTKRRFQTHPCSIVGAFHVAFFFVFPSSWPPAIDLLVCVAEV